MKEKPKLGIDIGRVIIDGTTDSNMLKAQSDEQTLKVPMMPGAFDAIANLNRVFEGRVWIVSKCGANMERKSRLWLRHHRFHEETGVPEERLRFCLKRPEKAVIAKELGITHFVDDRTDVLDHMRGIVPHMYLFNRN